MEINEFQRIIESLPHELLQRVVLLQSQVAQAGLQLENVMQTITDGARSVMMADGAIIELRAGEELVYRGASGPLAVNALGLRIRVNRSLSGLCMVANQLLRCDDTETDKRVDQEACRRVGLRSMLVAPLDAGGQVIGVLKIASSRPHAFSAQDEAVTRVLASFLATAIRNAEHTEATNQQFKTLANSLSQLVWKAEPDGSIYWYNDRWFEFTGTTLEQMQGWGWQSVHDPKFLPHVLKAWRNALREGTFFEMEFPLRRADGQFRWFLTRATPVKDQSGNVVRWFGTNTDIHEQTLAAQQLATAKLEAERANNLKTAFLANMSHEIRTPLGAILGFADLLKESRLTENERGNYLDIISRNGAHLNELINDILDLSKVEADAMKTERIPVSPRQEILDVVSSLRVKAEARSLTVELEGLDELPAWIQSDPVRLRQILTNVLGNAIKFTHRGRVRLVATCEKGSGGGTQMRLTISDTGAGIEPDDQPILFRPFQQGDSSITRRHGGTGLGLALSKRLANCLGGDLDLLHSAPGRGSVFQLRLENVEISQLQPEPSEPSHALERKTEAIAEDPLVGLRLLVVDDSTDNQQLVQRYLNRKGVKVTLANNGAEAVQAVMDGEFDAILMDLSMPVLDGYSATQKIRDWGYRRPIIAFTAHAMSEIRAKCLAIGFNDHVAKPIVMRELAQILLTHLRAEPSSGPASRLAALTN